MNGKDTGEEYESWLKLEYEQNFLQLRDRDEKILDLTKFYITVTLGAAGLTATLLGLKEVEVSFLAIGFLLLGTLIAGEIILIWMTAYRRYFVTCANQINAIRKFYSDKIPVENRRVIIQPIDPSYPPLLHKGSSQMLMIYLTSFINAFIASIAAYFIVHNLPSEIAKILISTFSFFFLIGANRTFLNRRLKVN